MSCDIYLHNMTWIFLASPTLDANIYTTQQNIQESLTHFCWLMPCEWDCAVTALQHAIPDKFNRHPWRWEVTLNDIDTMKTLIITHVRPLLKYSIDTLNPHTKCNIVKWEAVWRRATRWITEPNDDCDSRLSKLKLLSLSNRRFMKDVAFLFHVIDGHW